MITYKQWHNYIQHHENKNYKEINQDVRRYNEKTTNSFRE